MKKIYILVVLGIYTNLFSQSYYVNVPVYDTIKTGDINFYLNNCPIGETSIAPNLISNMPTGMNLYFKITSSQLPIGCLTITGIGIMNAGDSSLITITNKKFEWSALCGNGNATYAIIAAGTPLVLHDPLFCKSQWNESVSMSSDFCSSYFSTDYYDIGGLPACAISDFITSIRHNEDKVSFKVYPNPTVGNVKILINDLNDKAIYNLKIHDVLGREVKALEYETEFDISDLEKGIYFLSLYNNGTLIGTKKVVKE